MVNEVRCIANAFLEQYLFIILRHFMLSNIKDNIKPSVRMAYIKFERTIAVQEK